MMIEFSPLHSPVVVGVPPEGDFELLEELVHPREQRLRRARGRVDRRRSLEHNHTVSQVTGRICQYRSPLPGTCTF